MWPVTGSRLLPGQGRQVTDLRVFVDVVDDPDLVARGQEPILGVERAIPARLLLTGVSRVSDSSRS